jgi:transcription initiation factor TFIID TATA-box-binding protein
MIEIKVENIVASTKLAEKINLDVIAQSLEEAEYEPEQFPGLVYKLNNPKTATLLFKSGTANCTGAKSIEDVQTAIDIIAEKLEKIGIEVYENFEITIQNIVATADLGGKLNLTEAATALGLENVEYEPEQFPGLVYRVKEPKVAILLFGSGSLVCAGAKNTEDISKAVENLSEKLVLSGLLR